MIANYDPMAIGSLNQLSKNLQNKGAAMKRTSKRLTYDEVKRILDAQNSDEYKPLSREMGRTFGALQTLRWTYKNWLKGNKTVFYSKPVRTFFKMYQNGAQPVNTLPNEGTLVEVEPLIRELNSSFENLKVSLVNLVEKATAIRVKEEIKKYDTELHDLRELRDSAKNSNLSTMLKKALGGAL